MQTFRIGLQEYEASSFAGGIEVCWSTKCGRHGIRHFSRRFATIAQFEQWARGKKAQARRQSKAHQKVLARTGLEEN